MIISNHGEYNEDKAIVTSMVTYFRIQTDT